MRKFILAIQVPLFYIFAYMPVFLCHWLAKLLTNQLIRRPNAYRRRIDTNLRILMPELSAEKRNSWVAENLRFLTEIFLQMPRLLMREKNRVISRISEVRGKELALAASKEGKGVIFLLPHLGNWEILAPYLGKEFKSTALYKPLNSNHLDRILRQYRSQNGMQLVPISKTGIRRLLTALKRKEFAIILPDQNPGIHTAQQMTRFFGIDMPSPSLLAQLRAHIDARVVAVFAVQISPGNYRVEFHSPPKAIYSNDIQQSTQAVASCVEKCVRLYPTQYQWSYHILHRTEHKKEYG